MTPEIIEFCPDNLEVCPEHPEGLVKKESIWSAYILNQEVSGRHEVDRQYFCATCGKELKLR